MFERVHWSNTSNLLLNRSKPSINGTSSITENIGKTAGNGYKAKVTVNTVKSKNFSWSKTLNYSHYNTRLKDVGIYDNYGNPIDDVASRWFIGSPVNVNYDYVFNG